MKNLKSKRALRIHHSERIKKARERYWGRKLNDKELGMALNTPKTTQCACCGNPRRYFNEKTIQERRIEQDYK